MPPRHSPDPRANRAGVHCLWFPLGDDTGRPSATQAPSLPLPLEIKPALSGTTYSNSALRLPRVKMDMGPGNHSFPQSPAHTNQIKMILSL